MSNELTAHQLISFIRKINELGSKEVSTAFQNWFDNPSEDSIEIYICNNWNHEKWNNEIKKYLESLGFSVDAEYDTSFSHISTTITISVNNNINTTSQLSLIDWVRKLSKDNVPIIYESEIQSITEKIKDSANKASNSVEIFEYISNQVIDYFKEQGFIIDYKNPDVIEIKW